MASSSAAAASATPVSSPSSLQHGPSVVVILFVSLGCILFVSLCLFGLWLLIDRKRKRTVQGTEVIRADEHFKMKEDVVNGPHGEQAIALSVEKDRHFAEDIARTENDMEEIKTGDIERGESSSGPGAVLKP